MTLEPSSADLDPGLTAQGSGLIAQGSPLSELPVHQIGQWAMVWRRFRRHRLATIGAAVLLCMVALALIGPFFSPGFSQPDPTTGNIPLSVMQRANYPPQLRWPFIMGTDGTGSPVVSYLLVGGGPILSIGIFGAVLASLIGMVLGGLSGYLGGVVDALLMRLVDAFLAVPFLLLLILLSTYLTDRSVLTYILLFGFAGWPGVARLVRSYALSLREREFTVAARALGVSSWGIIGRHLLPNALDVIIVSLTLNAAVFMLTEVTLVYLGDAAGGVGANSWATPLLAAGPLGGYWWQLVFPGLAILLTVLAVNFLGDGLRDALESTSATALVTVTPGDDRERDAGPVWRRLRRSGLLTASLAGRSVAAVRRTATSAPGAAAQRVVPARVRDWAEAETVSHRHSAPFPVRVGPIVLVFLLVGTEVLYSHSPLEYAPNYSQPATYADLYGQTQFGARARPGGGWDVLAADSRSRLGYFQIDQRGQVREQTLGPGDYSSQPSLGKRGRTLLGAWVGDSGQDVWAAYLGGAHPRPFRLIPPGGNADLPFVQPVRLGFDVLFGWQPPGKSAHDIYLARIRPRPTPVRLVDLVRSGDVALAPKAAVDGTRALDVVYLQRTSRDFGEWQVRFQRFSLQGKPQGKPESLGRVTYTALSPVTGQCNNPAVQPHQWAIDVKRASDGSVWAAWATGNDCLVPRTGITGVNTISVAHWSPSGKQLLPPSPIDTGVEASGQAVALALQGSGGVLYYMQPGLVVSYLLANSFSGNGTPTGSERVSYEGGGNAANPVGASVGRYPAVLWEKVRAGDALLEGTSYHPHQPPDLLTRLGLNIGNLWENIALVVFGPIAGAVALSVINIFLLVPLVLVWLILRRLPPRLRWPLYLAAIAVLLTWVFARSSLPGYVLVMTSLGIPDAWYAVAGAVFVSGWSGRYLLHRQESGMRAAAMAVLALAFVAAMYTVMFIQGQITRI